MARGGAPPRALIGARRDGWLLVCHPAFREPLLALGAEVARLRARSGDGAEAPRAKLLRRVLDIILREVPSDPAAARYEQGNTLGADARGWRRVKFLGRLRLFFRFDSAARVIVYAWLNDETTLRQAGAGSDPYAVFRGMLVAGDPPHDWGGLLDACRLAAEGSEAAGLGTLLGAMVTVETPSAPPGAKPKRRR